MDNYYQNQSKTIPKPVENQLKNINKIEYQIFCSNLN